MSNEKEPLIIKQAAQLRSIAEPVLRIAVRSKKVSETWLSDQREPAAEEASPLSPGTRRLLRRQREVGV